MVANEDNLKKGKATQFRSGEEAARNGAKGGKASGAARRRKRDLKSAMKMVLDLPTEADGIKKNLEAMGISEEDWTNRVALVSRAFTVAMGGNVRAMEFIANITGETPGQKLEEKKFKAETQPQQSSETESMINAWFDSIPEDD